MWFLYVFAGTSMSRNLKDKYDNVNPRRTHTIMSAEDSASGRKSYWAELEITGNYDCIQWKIVYFYSCLLIICDQYNHVK